MKLSATSFLGTLLGFLTLIHAANSAPKVAAKGEVLEFGLFELVGPQQKVANKDTLDGSERNASGARFTDQTDQILATLGVQFGFRYKILGVAEDKSAEFKIVVTHPPIKNEKGETEREYSTKEKLPVKNGYVSEVTGYSLDRHEELVPGVWTFAVFYRDQKLVSQSFTVSLPERASAIEAASGQKNPEGRNSDVPTKKPLPKDFPDFRRQETALDILGSSGSGLESRFTKLWSMNRKLLHSLSEYTGDSIAALYGERMQNEKEVHVKLLMAALAAENGHQGARELIENTATNVDYEITLSRLSALHHLLFQDKPQGWVFDAAHEALSDTRRVSGMEKTNWVPGTGFEVSDLADERELLTYALGYAKNPSSVPVLVRMAKRTHGSRGPVTALGLIGDARGIPICLELLEQQDQAIKKKAANLSEPSDELTTTLAALKARAAVPILLSYLHSKEVIAALGRIGDERAVGPLQQIVAAQGRVDPDPYTWEKRFQERKNAATIALIRLGQDDPIPKWIALLDDRTLSWSERNETIRELGNHPDPRAVAPLLALVKSDPDAGMVNLSISVLSELRYKAAVLGLIECLDTMRGREISGKAGKSEYTPAMFAENIAKTLQTLSGQHLGPDKSLWKQWWLEGGQNVDSLK